MITHSYRVAIATKFLGPTNSRGSKIKAHRADDPKTSVTVDYDHGLGSFDNHAAAIQALIEKLGWTDTNWVTGGTSDGYVAVAVPR